MGGEPLVEYDLVREILTCAAAAAVRKGKPLSLGVTTNGLLLTAARARELGGLGCRVMLSFDGDEGVQTAQRVSRAGGGKSWEMLRRNLSRLVLSKTPFFVNIVVTPESAGRLSKGAAFLLGQGVRAFQISYALGVFWDEKLLDILEIEMRRTYRLADAARPPAEVFNRRNEAEPVLLSPQHVVDTDGQLYVGTSIVLEHLWPALHASFRGGSISGMKRLPGRRASPRDQLRLLRDAPMSGAARKTMINNLAVGKRIKSFWKNEVIKAPGSNYRARLNIESVAGGR